MPYKGREVDPANKTTLDILEVICLHVRLGELRVKVWFGVSRDLCTRVLFGTSFIDCILKGISPGTRNRPL